MPIVPASRLPLLLFLLPVAAAAAQDPSPRTQQRGGTFVEPPPVDPLYLPAGPDRRAGVPADDGRLGLSLRLALDLPLRRSSNNTGGAAGSGTQGSPPATPTLQAHLRWQPVASEPWFAQLGFYRYLHGDRQQPWNPDFTYGFGYESYTPGSFSLTYSNYAGNRLRPDAAIGEQRLNFPRGQWSAGYKFSLPQALAPVFLMGENDSALCSANLNLTPRYTDQASGGGERRGKESVSLGCRWSHPQGWFAHLTGFGYPQSGDQQPWDPDFTYGFGLAGGPITPFTLQYANYSGNRLLGRERGPGQGSWRNGSLTLAWSTTW